jgi:hypothetical protein
VDALEHARSAVGRLCRKGIGVVFPNNTWLAVNKKQRIAVKVQPGHKLAFDDLLKQVLANVAKVVVSKQAIANCLAAQCAPQRVHSAHIEPGGLVTNCCSEDAHAVTQKLHHSAFNHNTEVVGGDKMKDSKKVVLECKDV